MKTTQLTFFLTVLIFGLTTAQESCLEADNIKALDLQWEQALKNSDAAFFESRLADDFLWVHNHASAADTKADLIKRSNDPDASATGDPISRTSKDVQVLQLGSTTVLTGFTTVERETSSPKYNFMRTWVEVDGRCYLLASHTMHIPEGE